MGYGKGIDVDYKKLADDLLSYCHMHCADCEYAGENEFECTIARLSSAAITDLLARAEAAEEIVAEYEESARSVFLWLYEFCDGTLPSPSMIGTAARKVAREYADMKKRVAAADVRCKELEARCKRLDEARENANEAAAKWEGMYRMALERADMAEHDRDEAVHDRMMMEQRVGSLVERLNNAEVIASDICDDFTDFVTDGVHNAAPYCANRRPECVNAYGWCDGDNRACRGFMPKAAR